MNYIDSYIRDYSCFDFYEDIQFLKEQLDDIYDIQITDEEIGFLYPIFSERTYFAGWHDVFGFVVDDFAKWLQNL